MDETKKPLHPMAVAMKIPAISIGKMLVGPEAAGCSGTGTRPTIAHFPFGYYVGANIDVKDMIAYHCRQSARGEKLCNVFKTGERITRFYQTRKPALKYYRQLVSERLYMNDELRAEHRQAISNAKSSDPAKRIEGAIQLVGM